MVVGANYYPSNRIKLSGSVGYIDGATSGSSDPWDVTEWNWTLGVEYMFGKSIPVSTYLEYRGQRSEVNWSSPSDTIERDAINVGVRFYFGGDGDMMKADREGAGMTTPDIITWPRYYE